MKLTRFKFDTKLIIDTVIASVVVQQTPKLINQYFFSTNPLTGYTLEAAGAAAGVLVGMLFGKNDVGNISIALAGADIINGQVSTMLSNAGTQQTTKTQAIGDYSNNPYQLKDYNNSVQTLPFSSYQEFYN